MAKAIWINQNQKEPNVREPNYKEDAEFKAAEDWDEDERSIIDIDTALGALERCIQLRERLCYLNSVQKTLLKEMNDESKPCARRRRMFEKNESFRMVLKELHDVLYSAINDIENKDEPTEPKDKP